MHEQSQHNKKPIEWKKPFQGLFQFAQIDTLDEAMALAQAPSKRADTISNDIFSVIGKLVAIVVSVTSVIVILSNN